MSFIDILIIAIGLSMDAFAVSVCKGLSLHKIKGKHMMIAGAWFGGFQALMPFIGYLLGGIFAKFIDKFDHWIAFILLVFIGGKMLVEVLSSEQETDDGSMDSKTMFILAIATSIDALAVGVTFAFLRVAIIPAILIIGITTFILSALGVKIGSIFGDKFEKGAQIAGGIILILIGIKILLSGLGII